MRKTTVAMVALTALAGCSSVSESPPTVTTPTSRSEYTDGEYTATGWYGSLPSRITVSVTLTDNVITEADVTPHAEDPTSRDYQERFADAVPALVVGRPIDEVELDRVAGSSGTPEGFNDALAQIRLQASR
ncbi:FMN-binding protein [Micromonospora sp. WMMD812]|uniref:FMN-binding protein n=1 Tax=Micromonospora sp. WMMD812 TaxID=3015152 RepID=UPI00248B55FD|nr:FMN-binding protein [Micromonospora sp. WMMD812]WBB67731.1 FMN-binding protein [Micromonospora sp. WMMD812]